MRIEMMADGRVLEGTAVQIVQDMQSIAFGQEGRPLGEYIDWLVVQAGRMQEVDLVVSGETDEEKSASLLQSMLNAGLARKI